MESLHPQHKRILVIDGGGFRGLSSLLVIDAIMKAAMSRARKSLLPYEIFDIISGTSTGGLIAILLGRFGLDCATAIKVYTNLTLALCGNDESEFWKRFLNSADTGLDSKKYEEILASVVAEYTGLSETPMMMSDDGLGTKPHKVTKTFVTVTSDAPSYNNRIHCIRSYPTKHRVSPGGHSWRIQEAVRGTIASRVFMKPLFISKYGFRDAGFAGFNNPVELALEESQELWPNEEVGLVVSVGSGLTGLSPPHPTREWAVTDQFAEPFAEAIVSNLSASPSDAARHYALNIIKQFIALAVDTEIADAEAAAKLAPKGSYLRLNPSLGISNTDLIDCFKTETVKASVKAWLGAEGQKYISDVAAKLVDLNTAPISIADAHLVAPPKPPPNTNPGYNPQLDERRPETMIDYLRNYRVFLVIDDSGSMAGSRWTETRDALIGIAEHALEQDTKEIDMRFFNSRIFLRGVQGADQINSVFNNLTPTGYTPTGATLKKVLDEHITKLNQAVNTPAYHTIRPLDIIVLTDGVPTDKPKDILVDAVARMKAAKHHPNAIGVQIVQIGAEPDAAEALKELMFGDVGSMVDTVPYNGVLTPKKLERILLGGLHPNIRAQIQV